MHSETRHLGELGYQSTIIYHSHIAHKEFEFNTSLLLVTGDKIE